MNLSIPIIREVAATVREQRQRCIDAGWDIKWIAPPNLHIVLRHLGEISLALPEPIRETLIRRLEQSSPIELEARGIKPLSLPSGEQMVTASLGGELERLTELREQVEEEMVGLGFKAEPWPQEAHVIIGRVRKKGEQPLEELLGEVAERDFGRGLSRELVLYRSDVSTPKGEFARLWHLHLGGAPSEEASVAPPSPSPMPSEAGDVTPRPS